MRSLGGHRRTVIASMSLLSVFGTSTTPHGYLTSSVCPLRPDNVLTDRGVIHVQVLDDTKAVFDADLNVGVAVGAGGVALVGTFRHRRFVFVHIEPVEWQMKRHIRTVDITDPRRRIEAESGKTGSTNRCSSSPSVARGNRCVIFEVPLKKVRPASGNPSIPIKGRDGFIQAGCASSLIEGDLYEINQLPSTDHA